MHGGPAKGAELASGLGAIVLGAGLALVLPEWLRAYGLPLLVGGALVHGVGMTLKYRLERRNRSPLWWERALFWLCWSCLAALGAWLAAGFLAALVDRLVREIGVDPQRVFAAGVSNGGSMALRRALEDPTRYRAVAAALANVPAPQNFQCRPGAQTPSVMIMNGTADPLVPYDGGEINLLGLFYKGGEVLSSTASARYFADRNAIAGPPQVSLTPGAPGLGVEHARWRSANGRTEVELVTLHGAGHGLPQPWARRPRLLGPSPMAPDGPALMWAFFERQLR